MARESIRARLRETVEMWPRVEPSLLSASLRQDFDKRIRVIEALLTTSATITAIAKTFEVGAGEIRRWIARAQTKHPDGRLWGFRALVPNVKVGYVRTAAVSTSKLSKHGGDAGAFIALLSSYPSLEAVITSNAFLSDKSRQVVRKRSIRSLHRILLDHCRKIGIKSDAYPLNRRTAALRSLHSFVQKHELQSDFNRIGDSEIEALYLRRLRGSQGRNLRPYELVQLDGHELKLNVSLNIERPDGKRDVIAIDRIWLIAVTEVYSGAILGYSISPYENYNAEDVLRAIGSALYGRPSGEMYLPVPDSEYPGRSLPAEFESALQGVCWSVISFDNALSHTADTVMTKLTNIVGCAICRGAPAIPEFRAHVERRFRTIQHEMGLSGLAASRYQDGNSKKPSAVDWDEIAPLIDGMVWEFNYCRPSEGTMGRTPGEAVLDVLGDVFLRRVPSTYWGRAALLTRQIRKTVRGNKGSGHPPYIEWEGARYSGVKLGQAWNLVGKEVLFEYNEDNVLLARIYGISGHEIDQVKASGPWGSKPHSLRLRRLVRKLVHDRKLKIYPGIDFISAWANSMQERKSASKRSRSAYAENSHGRSNSVPDVPTAEIMVDESAPVLKQNPPAEVPERRRSFTF